MGSSPVGITISDFNGDTINDIAVSNSGSGNVSILLGVGNGMFGAAMNYTVGPSPLALTANDFNSDAIIDLVVVDAGNNKVSIILGNGTGGFGSATSYSVGTLPKSIRITSYNSDGLVSLYPNPAVESLMLDIPNGFAEKVNVFARDGRLILQCPIHSGKETININQLDQGIYFVQVGPWTSKLIKN